METSQQFLTTQEILDYIKSIPSKNFTIDTFTMGEKHYAMGWINLKVTNNRSVCSSIEFSNINGIDSRARRFLGGVNYLTHVNDGICPSYQQKSPKARVMAVLEDMIKAGV